MKHDIEGIMKRVNKFNGKFTQETAKDKLLRSKGVISAADPNSQPLPNPQQFVPTELPYVSAKGYKQVSHIRKEQLSQEAETFNTYPNFNGNENTPAGYVTSSAKGFRKQAAATTNPFTGTTSGGFRGSGGTVRQSPDIYSPLWLDSNLNLPRDRQTTNAWSRAFYALNGLVHNAIQLHSTYPISKLNITCENPKVEAFFQEMSEELDLLNVCSSISQEYWVIGEAFPYAELDEGNRKWSRILIQNPDYIVLQRSVIAAEPIISLRPDENLRRIVNSNRPIDMVQRERLDPSIIEHVRRGEHIPLDNLYVSHIARKLNPYDTRGTGIITPIFRPLMFFDKIYEAKFAQFNNMINPLTLVKIGNDNYKPTPADLEAYRETFTEASYDKDFKVFCHDAVNVERVGYNQGVLDVSNDITQIIKLIYAGLMVPGVIMDGGADTTYSNGTVALDVLKNRYLQFQSLMTSWLRRKIFAPISKLNDFYEYVGTGKDRKKMLIVPNVEWNHLDLFQTDSYIGAIKELATADENKRASYQTLYRVLGLDWRDEQSRMRDEDIAHAIRQKEIQSLETMSLNELRSLGDKEIPEAKPEDIERMPGETMPGMGGGEMGGMESLPGEISAPTAPMPTAPTPTGPKTP